MRNVYPGYSFIISVKGSVNPYMPYVFFADQILFLVLIILLIALAYVKFGRVKITAIPKISEMPKFINLIESLVLSNEEIEHLDDQLEKGLIKKQDYNLRVSSLRREMESKENDMKRLLSTITSRFPETRQIMNEIFSSYFELIKERNALKELKNAYKMRKVQPESFRSSQ